MSRGSALVLVTALLLLGGCAGNALRGTVTDIDSGAPIEGATVTVGQARATSAADGSFEIEVEAWETPVPTAAEAPGYPRWERLRSFPRGLDRWSIRLSKTGRYR